MKTQIKKVMKKGPKKLFSTYWCNRFILFLWETIQKLYYFGEN